MRGASSSRQLRTQYAEEYGEEDSVLSEYSEYDDDISVASGGTARRHTTELSCLISGKMWEKVENRCEIESQEACIQVTFPAGGGNCKALPLHLACLLQPPVTTVNCLLQAYPESARIKEAAWDLLPLHFAVMGGASVDVVEALIVAYPVGLQMKESFAGYLPLHIACYRNAGVDVIERLIFNWPIALEVKDVFGDTPVDVVRKGCHPSRVDLIELMERADLTGCSPPRNHAEKVKTDDNGSSEDHKRIHEINTGETSSVVLEDGISELTEPELDLIGQAAVRKRILETLDETRMAAQELKLNEKKKPMPALCESSSCSTENTEFTESLSEGSSVKGRFGLAAHHLRRHSRRKIIGRKRKPDAFFELSVMRKGKHGENWEVTYRSHPVLRSDSPVWDTPGLNLDLISGGKPDFLVKVAVFHCSRRNNLRLIGCFVCSVGDILAARCAQSEGVGRKSFPLKKGQKLTGFINFFGEK